MASKDSYDDPQPISFQTINSAIITTANTYLAMALTVPSKQNTQNGSVFEEKVYHIPSGEVIYVYKRGEFIHHITTGDGDAYTMQVDRYPANQPLDQNKLEAACVLLEIYAWYHKHD